jgi:hypothetical protein
MDEQGYIPSIIRQAEVMANDKWENIVKNRNEYILSTGASTTSTSKGRKMKFTFPIFNVKDTKEAMNEPPSRSDGSYHIKSRLSFWASISTINKTV